jgi:hypothetical protein
MSLEIVGSWNLREGRPGRSAVDMGMMERAITAGLFWEKDALIMWSGL